MVCTKIYPEEQLLTRYCVARYLQFLVIHSMLDINKDSPQWFDKTTTTIYTGIETTSEDQKLANELHKSVIKKSKKQKIYSSLQDTYIDYGIEHNDKDPKSKFGNLVRISKYKSFFVKCYIPNLSEEVLVIKK